MAGLVRWEGLRRRRKFVVRVGMILGGGLGLLRGGIMRSGWGLIGLEDYLFGGFSFQPF